MAQELTLKVAQDFAESNFKKLPELEQQWNILHIKYMIKSIRKLSSNKDMITKLIPLVWVHDIGKAISEENHSTLSLKLLIEAGFRLTKMEEDCIINHGSSAKPETEEGKILRLSDGLSLFYPEIVNFLFYSESKSGKKFEEIKQFIINNYNKYSEKYKSSEIAIKLLNKLFKNLELN